MMPATLNDLRIGETIRVGATVRDGLGNIVTAPDAPDFDALAGDGVFVNVFLVSGEPLLADIEGVAPGADTIHFTCRDSFDSAITANAPVTVIDASGFRFDVFNPANCSINHAGAIVRVLVDPEPAGDPSFTLKITPIDSRRDNRSAGPVYALSDGPNSVSTHGRILLNGNGAGTPVNDDDEVGCIVTQRGEETITVTGTTDATGAQISGVVQFLIVTASTAVIEQVS
jgi:hypothetical protein